MKNNYTFDEQTLADISQYDTHCIAQPINERFAIAQLTPLQCESVNVVGNTPKVRIIKKAN